MKRVRVRKKFLITGSFHGLAYLDSSTAKTEIARAIKEEVGHLLQTSWARVPDVHSFLTSLGNLPETWTKYLLL